MTSGQNDLSSVVNKFLSIPLDLAQETLTKDDELLATVCGYCIPNGEWNWTEGNRDTDRYLSVVPPLLTRLATIPRNSTVFITMVYYLYSGYPWVKSASRQIAIEYIDSNREEMHVSKELMELMEPAFVKKHDRVSEAGRKKISTQQNSFNQHSFNFFDTRSQWEVDNSTLSLFEYFIREQPLQEHWAFAAPTVLNITDHHNALIKAKGCEYIELILGRVERAFFAATGLEPVFWDAVTPSLSYLPPSTPQEASITLINQATRALLAICDTMADPSQRYNEVMRTAVFKGMTYAGDNIAVAEALVNICGTLIARMGLQACIHLKKLVVLFSGILVDPFGSAYMPLIEKVCDVLLIVYANCWPRIEGYKYDLARGFISSWKRINQDDPSGTKNKSTRLSLKNAWRGLDDIVEFSEDEVAKLKSEFDLGDLMDG